MDSKNSLTSIFSELIPAAALGIYAGIGATGLAEPGLSS